jgi:hypothetical protein
VNQSKPSSRNTHHESQITHHESQITHHESQITHHESQITHHESQITHHTSALQNRQTDATIANINDTKSIPFLSNTGEPSWQLLLRSLNLWACAFAAAKTRR